MVGRKIQGSKKKAIGSINCNVELLRINLTAKLKQNAMNAKEMWMVYEKKKSN